MLPKITPSTLSQRIAIYVLAPTLFMLLASGFVTFQTSRDLLLDEWVDKAKTQLKNSAHLIDSQLEHPKAILKLIHNSPKGPMGYTIHQYLISTLENIEGVEKVDVDWPTLYAQEETALPERSPSFSTLPGSKKHIRSTLPVYTEIRDNKEVLLSTFYKNEYNKIVGKVELTISLPKLLAKLTRSPWWLQQNSYILDSKGEPLLHNNQFDLTGDMQEFHKKVVQRIATKKSDTLFSTERPPKEVAVFHQLAQAEWTLLIIAQGEKVLQPLIRFRQVYLLVTIITALTVLFTIYYVTAKINSQINTVSEAARRLSEGHFGTPLIVESGDELGNLCQNFNEMTCKLKEGVQLQKAMEIAREVQQNFLPQTGIVQDNLGIAGKCIYCDETGGDYFDFIVEPEKKRYTVVVGDVVGHGIGAALLMTTTRALIRSEVHHQSSLGEAIQAANNLLCQDTKSSCNFVTLFAATCQPENRTISWVRAGHEPAIVYNQCQQRFYSLQEKGIALGLNPDYQYSQQTLKLSNDKHLIIIGTDGIWECENSQGEQFGKERLQQLISDYSQHSAQQISDHLGSALSTFQSGAEQLDDITFVVIKFPAYEKERH